MSEPQWCPDCAERAQEAVDSSLGFDRYDDLYREFRANCTDMTADEQSAGTVFHVELDISMDYRNNHEAFVILDALEEYASRQRWLAEDGGDNTDFQVALADTADQLRERIDAQMGDANVRKRITP